MVDFSITEAACTGLRFAEQRPKAVLFLALAQWALTLLVIGAMFIQFGPILTQLTTLSAGERPSPAEALAMFKGLAPLYLELIVGALAFYGVLFSAMNRAVLRPDDDAFGYLRLGADELRQIGLMLLLMLLGLGIEVVCGIVLGVALVVLHLVLPPAATAPLRVLVAVAVVAAFVFLHVRFSLASADTFASKRISVFGSWNLTKGYFWPMLGTYVLAFFLFIVLALVCWLAIFAITYFLPGGGFTGLRPHPGVPVFSTFFTPAAILGSLLESLAYAVALPVLLTPAPAIYRALA